MKRLNKVWNDIKKEGKQFDKSEEGTWIRIITTIMAVSG
jgi:hypothetical protein